jgi:hypothetical protein
MGIIVLHIYLTNANQFSSGHISFSKKIKKSSCIKEKLFYLCINQLNKKTMKVVSSRITEQPKSFFDPMPKVYVTMENGVEEFLFEYYPDEISFTPDEFVGLTIEECRHLKFVKDKKYLQS